MKITITKTTAPKTKPDSAKLGFGKYFTDAELTKLASNKIINKREYWVGEFTVKANETTAFGHAFAVDNR